MAKKLLIIILLSAFYVREGFSENLYFASNNVVYYSPVNELSSLSGLSIIPLTIKSLPRDDQGIIFFFPLENTIKKVPLTAIVSERIANISDILIDNQKMYIPSNNPAIFKTYPTYDAPLATPLAVTETPYNGKICAVYMPRDDPSFPGGICTITDIRTGKDVASFKVKELYASLARNLTWISDRYVIFGVYSQRGNEFSIIDIKNKCFLFTNILHGMEFFSKNNSEITGYFYDANGNILTRSLQLN